VLGCGVPAGTVLVEVPGGCCVVAEAPGTAGVGVVTVALGPSPGDGELTGVSAPSAPPARGPPRPAAVSPLPASADSIARHAHPRARVIGFLCPSWSFMRSHSRGRRSWPTIWGAPTGIHIGRQAETRKGFVIALHDHSFSQCHDKQSGLTVPVPEAERPMLAKLLDFGADLSLIG
jgi:hypothetical protein